MITLVGIAALFLGLCLFFLPSLLAHGKEREDKVVMVNVFFGSSIVGWLVSLCWAVYQCKQLPFGLNIALKKFESKFPIWGKWVCVVAGFIFLLMRDFRNYKKDKVFIDFSVFKHMGISFWDIAALKWLPLCMQFLLLIVLANFIVGFKTIRLRSAILLTGSMALILFALNYIKPGAIEYLAVLWSSFFLYSFSIKE